MAGTPSYGTSIAAESYIWTDSFRQLRCWLLCRQTVERRNSVVNVGTSAWQYLDQMIIARGMLERNHLFAKMSPRRQVTSRLVYLKFVFGFHMLPSQSPAIFTVSRGSSAAELFGFGSAAAKIPNFTQPWLPVTGYTLHSRRHRQYTLARCSTPGNLPPSMNNRF